MERKWIEGGSAEDGRGKVSFINDYDMKNVRRMYRVANSLEHPFRGWIAHRAEQKWFVSVSGRVSILLVKVDSFESPSRDLKVERFTLDEAVPGVLHVPGGYAIGIKSETPGASVMVFSDCLLNAIPNDVWRWAEDFWTVCP